MKSNVFILCVLNCITLSCTKTITTNTVLNSATAIQSINSVAGLPKNTKFGSSIGGNFTGDQCVSEAQKLNVDYVRMAIYMDVWDGKSTLYENYTLDGINVIPNIQTSSLSTSAPFPKNLTNYRQTLNSITDKYQPELIALENEEINPLYHSGPMTDYISMLKVALNVCHAKGIKVTNGGIYGPQLEVLTYRYLQTKDQKRADSFGYNCMVSSQIKSAQKPGANADLEKKIRQLDTLLNFYSNLDYVNVHLYEIYNPYILDPSTVTTATPVVVADIQEYLKVRTGKPVITNETTPRGNTSPLLVNSILSQYAQLNFPYVIWYSNDGVAGGSPLYDLNTGSLYSNGLAFASFMQGYNTP